MEPAPRARMAASQRTCVAGGAPGGAHAGPGRGMDVDLAREDVCREASSDGPRAPERKEKRG